MQQRIFETALGSTISFQTLWLIARLMLGGVLLVAINEQYRVVGILGLLAAAGVLGIVLAILLSEYRVTFDANGVVVRRPFSVQTFSWDRVSHLQRSGVGPLRWSLELVNPSSRCPLPSVLEDDVAVRNFHRSLALAKARWGRKPKQKIPSGGNGPIRTVERWGDLAVRSHDLRRNSPCPWCDYKLIGHPAQSICPSCGNAYSPALRVWEAPRKFETTAVLITLTPIAAWGIYLLVLFFQGHPLGMGHKLGLGAFFAIGLLIAFVLEKRAARDGNVIVDEFGIEVRRNMKAARIEWAHILGIRRDEMNIVLNTPAGPRRIDRFFATAGDAEEFVRYADGVKKGADTPKSRESLTK